MRNDHQILTIFNENVFDTTVYQKAVQVSTNSPMCASALPGKSKTSKPLTRNGENVLLPVFINGSTFHTFIADCCRNRQKQQTVSQSDRNVNKKCLASYFH